MTEITIKCGFGVISGLDFRDDIVKKGSDLLAGGHIKEVRRNSTYYLQDVFRKHLEKSKVVPHGRHLLLLPTGVHAEDLPDGGDSDV